ncbi:MAG: hypothetical protein ACOH5I_00055 [Oligoflexus sp.]
MHAGPNKTVAVAPQGNKKESNQQSFTTRAKRHVPLSRESLSQVFTLVGKGQRLQSCDLIRQSLNVNDFIAEWCIRHIEDQIVSAPEFIEQAMQLYDRMIDCETADYRAFLNQVLGIHGHAASGLLAKLHR